MEQEGEADTLEIDLKDALTGVAVTLRYTVYADYDVLAIECMQPRFLGGEKSPGQMIGAETYETCYMIGRCMQLAEGRGKDVQRVMRSEERAAIMAGYGRAARNAKRAGRKSA